MTFFLNFFISKPIFAQNHVFFSYFCRSFRKITIT